MMRLQRRASSRRGSLNTFYGGIDVRFTRKGDGIYAILLSRPEGGEVTIEGITPAEDALISMIGSGYREWSAEDGNLKITLPEEYPEAHAYTFKISKL